MAQTYAELQTQIEKLKLEAEHLRQDELATVLTRIRADIEAYQLTPQDLFGKNVNKAQGKAPKARAKAQATSTAKYTDGSGNAWTGRGPRPRWLREALAAGKQLGDFAAQTQTVKVEAAPPAKAVKATRTLSPAKKPAPGKAKKSTAKQSATK